MFKADMSIKEAVFRLSELDEQITELYALILLINKADKTAIETVETIIKEKEFELKTLEHLLDEITLGEILLIN